MPYRVEIRNELGEPLRGTVYLYSGGALIGEAGISPGGSTLSNEEIESADHFKVESDGYHYYGTSQLYETNVFTLAKKQAIGVYIGLALVGGFLLSKLVKFKL